MSEQTENSMASKDGMVDAWAAICLISIAVAAAIFWVSGQ